MKKKLCLCTLFLLFLNTEKVYASPSFFGDEGYINTPASEVITEKTMALGLSYLPGASSYIFSGNPNLIYSLFLGFLPRTELGIVFNQVFTGLQDNDNPYLKTSAFDRSVNLKIQILEDKDYWPSLSVGGRDIISNSNVNPREGIIVTSHQQIFYISAGKTFQDFRFNTGYSYAPELPIGFSNPSASKITNRSFKINGFFAAIETPRVFNISGIIEYDSKNFNYGLNIGPFWNFTVKAAMINLINFNIRVNWSPKL